MFKKILAFVLLSVIMASCTSKKHYIQTTKNGTAKTSRKKKSTPVKTKTATAGTTKKNDDRQVEVLESTSKTVVYSELVKQYVMDYKGIAQQNMKNHGVPASITLAQGILESGAGQGTLCVSANNHFGIKCHTDWTGDKVYHDDDSEQECFRKYAKASESFNDHSLFLTTRGRYASLFELDKDDYKAWAKGLRAAGYATDPKYPDKLVGLIERYDLAQYDAEVLGKDFTPTVKPVTTTTTPQAVVVAPATPKPVANTTQTAVTPAPVATTPSVAQATSATENTVGATDGSHTVVKGDTLYSISKKHNTTVDALIQLNGLAGNAISIGQVLKVK
ncbi:LysM peptidoglycan-binding domain-containing protein [Flavobacterium zepuense]|uniref:Peptidoglycan hydrolase n=1 Tax=Flavobacterium zepuense TaxID=2593302 RepID=A0A552V3U3_9FLAO|nr:glucosaminidase domain-containing protein [Flavobacterium zepuense]TRW25136.1 LysM peptidoglycan-binding domain-containing protein [Flavobacterium zepuense]